MSNQYLERKTATIFQGKMTEICWFLLLKFEDLLAFHRCEYEYVWAVGEMRKN